MVSSAALVHCTGVAAVLKTQSPPVFESCFRKPMHSDCESQYCAQIEMLGFPIIVATVVADVKDSQLRVV